ATQTSFAEGLKKEREYFMQCLESPQSAGLRHAFFAEREVSKVPGIDKETPVRDCSSAAVIGAGTMGAGIAYSCLSAGLKVKLLDNSDEGLERGRKIVEGLFAGGVKRGKISESEMEQGLSRFATTQDYTDLADVDIVIEAVFESMAVKKEVFGALDKVVKAGAILATNTSTLSIDEIAASTSRPGDVIGLHFFSPAHIMRLLEIVKGAETRDDVIATSLALAKSLGKIGVVVGNCFGFVGNRMLYSYGRESQLLLLEGAAPEYVDKTLYDWGMAMGPNAVGDLAGLDVGYKIRQERTDLPDDPRFYRVADMLAGMGRFGQKTGKGTYLYEDGSREPTPDPEVDALIRAEADKLGVARRDISEDEIIERCIYGLIVEGAKILEEGIAIRSSDIDVVWMNGYGFPRHRGGPMHYADSIGLDKVYETVCGLKDRFGPLYWDSPKLLQDLAKSGGRFADVGD
ncbi:MAG: 3-hydroxyacyl-CoA dehydrogenase NAD-binding domain-containing protein, partial [Woeseiaceae bacterium]